MTTGEDARTQGADSETGAVQRAREAESAAYEHYGLNPTEHYIDVDDLGIDIRTVVVGEGPPLVLINGGEGKGVPWLPLLPELEGYTLYVMDRPGSGLSDGIDYRSRPIRDLAATSTLALFDHFDLDTAPIVGNSMGGLWTLRFAQAHQDRVTSIGLLGCPAVYPGTSAPLLMRIGSISALSGFIAGNILQADGTEDVHTAWKFLGHPAQTRQRLPDVLAEAWYRMDQFPRVKTTWIGILQRVLRLRGAHPDAAFTPQDLRSIEVPVTLIWGSEDPFGSVEKGREGATYFQNADFNEVGVGHLPWFDEPEICGEILREHIG